MANDVQVGKKEFIRLLMIMMEDRGVENPNQLYRLLKDRGPNRSSPSRSLIHGYFKCVAVPQRWFLREVFEVLMLGREQRCRLALAYLKAILRLRPRVLA